MNYKLTSDPTVVVRTSDNTFIREGHRFWEEYQEWRAAGNIPQPADIVDYLPANTAALWQAAHDYEYASINGSAIGLLALSVAAGRPMALAVQGWLHGIWTLYYSRKAAAPSDRQIDPAQLDYSEYGAMPHSIPELMAEAGYYETP